MKANSEKLNLAHTGVGSNSFTYALLLNATMGTKPTLIPFGSNAPAMTALLGGQVDYFMATILDVGSHLETKAVKVFAFGAPKRHPLLPDVPTTIEVGLPNMDSAPWWALFAPKGTARPIVDKLSEALDKALDDENTRKRLLELGGDIPDKDIVTTSRQGREDRHRSMDAHIKEANVKIE